MHRPPPTLIPHQRRGTAAPLVIIALGVMFAVFALPVNKAWLWSVREDLTTAADASALAAALALVDDDTLRGDVTLYPDLLTRATAAANKFAAAHTVRRLPLQLFDNIDNDTNGDLVFGVLTTPRAGNFTPVAGRQTVSHKQLGVNTVVVHARQTRARGNAPGLIFGAFAGRTSADAQATVAATFDRGTRGVKPRFGPVPLAPVAILSGADPRSWETTVESRTGPDGQRFDKNVNAFIADSAGDRIHEFEAVLATDAAQVGNANVVLLQWNTADMIQIAGQLENQLTADDLAIFGRKFVLPDEGGQAVPAQQLAPAGDSPEVQELARVLNVLKQESSVRIWPLYTQCTGGQALITGFVAARVVSVTPPAPDQPLQFLLQPTVISRPDVVTDTDLRGPAATMNNNPYVGRVRRIE